MRHPCPYHHPGISSPWLPPWSPTPIQGPRHERTLNQEAFLDGLCHKLAYDIGKV